MIGTPTDETLDLMSQERCGVPDITTNALRVSKTRRKKRYALHGETNESLKYFQGTQSIC